MVKTVFHSMTPLNMHMMKTIIIIYFVLLFSFFLLNYRQYTVNPCKKEVRLIELNTYCVLHILKVNKK